MKKIILLAGLVAGGVALSVTASANNWLLYLPAILAGSGGGTEPPPVTESNKWLLFLPPILAGSQGGPVITEPPFNDTGIILTTGSGTGEEDADYGRDKAFLDDPAPPDDGHAGFSFTKLDSNGNDGTNVDGTWNCVRDNVTGLVWTDYATWGTAQQHTWLAAQETYAPSYTNCGISSGGWRLPTPKELMSIVAYNLSTQVVDGNYFHLPGSVPLFWTTRVYQADSSKAWYLGFDAGYLDPSDKGTELFVRLVHDGGTSTAAQLTDNGDGTVTDASTGLIWKKCLEGYSYSSPNCTPTGTTTFTWLGALGLADTEWRLPNIKELQSIVDYQSSSPAVDPAMFPGVPAAAEVWSNSPVNGTSGALAWYHDFSVGYTLYDATGTYRYVRLVKDDAP